MIRRFAVLILSPIVLAPNLHAQKATNYLEDAAEFLDQLKAEALGFARSCDYLKYLEAAQTIAGEWPLVKSLFDWKPSGKVGVPVTDPLAFIASLAGSHAAEESVEKQGQSLIYQLEQVCQLALQADETNRIYQIVHAGRIDIGNALNWLRDQISIEVNISEIADTSSNFGVDYARAYERIIPPEIFSTDTVFAAVMDVIYSTLRASEEMIRALHRIENELKILKDQLRMRAEAERRGGKIVWTCPEGYPGSSGFTASQAASLGLEFDETGIPICGPASPERAQQILAATEILKAQIATIQQAAQARMLEIEAARLMVDNHHRREKNFLYKNPGKM